MESECNDVFARALKVLYECRAAELGFPNAKFIVRKNPEKESAPPDREIRQGSRP